MNYPLISEYVEAIRFAEDNFSTLTNLRPVLENGRPFMSSGNFAVVFKMKDVTTGKLYAVKCFTREEEHRERSYRLISDELNGVDSPYLTSIKYLEKELFVDVSGSAENEFPILLMDWVEGQTMDAYIRENINDKWELERLCRNFCHMGAWLLEQPFAHGDLKPENIMVSDGAMPLLVDYDGMYVPAMKGEGARELGSPDYRHPLRTEKDFDEHIDDFPLASIALSLKAISLDPSLLTRYGAADRLLFKKADYTDLSKCAVLKEMTSLCSDSELQKLFSIFLLVSSLRSLPTNMSQMFIPTDQWDNEEILSTEVTDEDLAEAWEDEYGVLYSKDRKRLLKCKNKDIIEYVVREGTRVICDRAFSFLDNILHSIIFPTGLISIGETAFFLCKNLTSIKLPDGLTSIGNRAFSNCDSLTSIILPNSLTLLGDGAFSDCGNLASIELPDNLSSIGKSAFCYCRNLTSIELPNSLTSICDNTFAFCDNLASVELPNNLTSIGDYAFDFCYNLVLVELPNSLVSIGVQAFRGCKNLIQIKLPDSLTFIGDGAFLGCKNLTEIKLPRKLQKIEGQPFNNIIQISNRSPFFKVENDLLIQNNKIIRVSGNPNHAKIPALITSIDNFAFSGCKDLLSIDLPYGLTSIGNSAFSGCENLTSIVLPDSLTSIGDRSFENCKKLAEIEFPNSLTAIGDYTFMGCYNLISITLPKNLQKIGTNPFLNCDIQIISKSSRFRIDNYLLIQNDAVKCASGNPKAIIIPDYITHIEDSAFEGCDNLISIKLPNALTSIGYCAFEGCKNLTSIKFPSNSISIGNSAFKGCSNMTSIELPDNLTSISGWALEKCKNLEKIYISCAQNADKATVLEKFKRQLPKELHSKIVLIDRR